MLMSFEKWLAVAGIILVVACVGFPFVVFAQAGFIALALAVPALATPSLLAFAVFVVSLLVVLNQETLLVFGIAL